MSALRTPPQTDMNRQIVGTAALYTPDLLRLAIELADYPIAGAWDRTGEARSSTCGSTLRLGCDLDIDGRIARLGLAVTACAVGQASAAIFVHHAVGRDHADIAHGRTALRAWLTGEGGRPDWPRMDLLDRARDYPGRHGAILLPWTAAADALSLSQEPG